MMSLYVQLPFCVLLQMPFNATNESMIYTTAPPADSPAFGFGFPTRDLPTPEDCANILQSQASLMQQLEIENKYVRVRVSSIYYSDNS